MPHPSAASAEEWLAHDPASELWGEHRSRYHFARQRTTGLRVLDIACGAGFGLSMLHDAGTAVIGVDIKADALAQTRANYPAARVVRANGASLPFSDEAFDGAISFETLEHVLDPEQFVAELSRVLKPDGFAAVSTPNREFGAPAMHQNNPYHLHEFSPTELAELLEQRFSQVTMYGQRPSPHYRYVPFRMWRPSGEPSEVAWKLFNRLPFRVKNRLSQALHQGRDFYPGERDYRFEKGQLEDAHALFAIAVAPIRLP